MAIKDLYTDVKAQVLFLGSLSTQFDVSQGTGQSRTLAPFMCTVHMNSLLKELSSFYQCIKLDLSLFCGRYIVICHSTILPNSPHVHVLLLQLEVEI